MGVENSNNYERLALYIFFRKLSGADYGGAEIWDMAIKEGRGSEVLKEVMEYYQLHRSFVITVLTNGELPYIEEHFPAITLELHKLVTAYLDADDRVAQFKNLKVLFTDLEALVRQHFNQ